MIEHVSVLQDEAVQALNPRPDRAYVDGTLGGGGHAARLCGFLDERNVLIGIDQDPVAVEKAKERLTDCRATVTLVHGNFGHLHRLLIEQGFPRIDGGIMLDLGVSAFQIRTPERGFSFHQDAPLDMRMNPTLPTTAADLVNTLSAQDLANLFYRYADERLSRPIAAAIVKARPLHRTGELAQLVEGIYRQKGAKTYGIHPATRVFQALRMEVNQELQMLEQCLEQLPTVLLPGARVAIITFHSVEDRLVKQFFRTASAACLCPPRQPVCTCGHVPSFQLIGKPITPSPKELETNPQARSAKLRVAERL